MGGFGGFIDKAKSLAGQHADKVEQGIEKAGDAVDKHTCGRYSNQVDKAQAKAGDLLDKATSDDAPPPANGARDPN